MSVPITTPPVRLPLGNDTWYAREKLVDGIGNLNTNVSSLSATTTANATAINGNLSFGNIFEHVASGNLKTQMFQGTTPATANTPFTLTHSLGVVPNGALLIQSNAAAILYGDMTDQAWTTTTITLLCSVASINYVIMVLG